MNIPFDENNNILMFTNKLKTKKKGKPFTERAGDWICSSCKNLNFAFRVICNRCHLSKNESQKFYKDKENDKENNYKYNSENENNVNKSMSTLNEENVDKSLKK